MKGGCTGLLQPLCPDAPPLAARAAFSLLQSPEKKKKQREKEMSIPKDGKGLL